MPSKSKAQMREMFALRERGEITAQEMKDFTPTKEQYKELPERVRPKRSKRGD